MNYDTSREILKLIKRSESVIIMAHQGADHDSAISALLTKRMLEEMGKKADICSIDELPKTLKHLDPQGFIKKCDFNRLDFGKYDLFFALDVSELRTLGLDPSINIPIPTIRIDHHEGDKIPGTKLVDVSAGSTAGLLYFLFEDLGIKLNRKDVDLFLLAIVADSGVFNYGVTPRLLRVVAKLIDQGGDYEDVLFQLNRRNSLGTLNLWSEALARIIVDRKNRFAYTALPFSVYENLPQDSRGGTRAIADTFLRTVEGTNFGIVMVEQEKHRLKVSIRSRVPGYHTYDLLLALGGGGHADGGGALIKDLPFDEAVRKVLAEARKFSRSHPSLEEQVG